MTSGMDDGDSNDKVAHLVVGLFLCAFGLSLLGLTVVRIRRLMRGASDANVLRRFLAAHVPERSPAVLKTASISIGGAGLFGMTWTMLGARFVDRDLHPDYTIFHYVTHLAALAPFVFVGWTGWLEYKRCLPAESLRAALAVALWAEALLWVEHARSKASPVGARLHLDLGILMGLTAAATTASIVVGSGDPDRSPTAPFLLYVATPLGLVWQGAWFLTIAVHLHQRPEIPTSGHAVALFVLEGLALLVLGQLVTIYLVREWRRQRPEERRGLV